MSSLKKYKRVKYLGKGSYGAAILVELRSDPSKKFVIKEIVIGHLKPAEQASAKSEADVLHQMNHSNITMYVESFVENSKLYIVMEHADGGDLSGNIQKRKASNSYYAEDEVMRIFVQICLALKHVHNANILHRDLKSQNIFLTLKGMVKLGDFGIAKVLDASDDQARTQIGTPYYLSPEICESKPYGRKSDVWSLGVVLYEIIALEMPFQAQSLPALVVKICSGEPNYKTVENRYSPALIALTRSMLHKNPDKRPSLNQIVKTDFIMSHISKLLSYTLKMGTGGVENVNPQTDPDEADRNIEQARNRQREQEQELDSKRNAHAEQLRKFKQEQKSRHGGLADASNAEECKDARARGRSPVRGASPKRDNNRSPTRGGVAARAQSPLRGGAASPRRGNSPVRNNVSNEQQPVRSGNAVNNNMFNREVVPPVQRRNYGYQQQQQDEGKHNEQVVARNAGPPPRVAPNPSYPSQQQQQQYQQHQAIGRGKSLAEMQADKQRDNAVIDAMRRGSGANEGNSRHSLDGGDGRGGMIVVKSKEDPYETAARREFFANRAAAQAAKARVDQDIFGGDGYTNNNNVQRGGGGGGGQLNVMQQHPSHVRRNSEGDYYSGSASPYDDNRSEAEIRIAMIKAQKEKDRERELALKDLQIKQAIVDNREDRSTQRKGAVAFEIDLSGDQVKSKVISPPPLRSDARRRQSNDSKETSPIGNSSVSPSVPRAKPQLTSQQSASTSALPVVAKKSGLSVQNPTTAAIAIEEELLDDMQSCADGALYQPANNAGRQKKGWGNPINPNEVPIAKGVARFATDKSSAHDMFEREQGTPTRSNGKSSGSSQADSSESTEYLSNRASLDGANYDSDAPVNDTEVRRFLANKRASAFEARQQAKLVLGKLREQKQKEAENKPKRIVRKSVIGADSKSNDSKAHVPLKARLMDVMSSVETANESVQKAMAANNKRQPPSVVADSKISGSDEVELDEEEEIEDDLQDTLGNWLQQQKRGVTTRRKPTRSSVRQNSDDKSGPDLTQDDVIEDELIVATTPGGGTAEGEDRVLLSDDMGNDVEVVGLQCMLAEALMRPNNGDDISTDEEDNDA